MRFKLSERELVVAAATGATAFIVVKRGVLASIPQVGPVTPPIGAIILGVAISSFIDGAGSGGAAIEGIGYGLIAAGAIAL